mgnify:CR=1 FL=1
MAFKLNILVLTLLLSHTAQARITDGLWSTGCSNGLNKEQVFEGNQVATTEHFYQDTQCSDESFRFQTLGSVNYYNEQADFIDFVYAEIYLTLFKETIVEDFNTRKVCGVNNWKSAQAKNITGLKCAIFNTNKETQIPKAADQKYGIFRLEKNKLYYGQLSRSLDGSSAEKRPVRLNSATEYIFRN